MFSRVDESVSRLVRGHQRGQGVGGRHHGGALEGAGRVEDPRQRGQSRHDRQGVKSAGVHEGEMRTWIEAITPMRRVGKVEEIASSPSSPRKARPASPTKRCT